MVWGRGRAICADPASVYVAKVSAPVVVDHVSVIAVFSKMSRTVLPFDLITGTQVEQIIAFVPLTHENVHTLGPTALVKEGVQVQPASTWQVELQPSPDTVFPSSHCSKKGALVST